MAGLEPSATWWCLAALVAAGCQPATSSAEPSASEATAEQVSAYEPYLARRAAHQTTLRYDAPSPNRWSVQTPPPDVQQVEYPSDVGPLPAWFAVPTDAAGPVPAVVYFHGDFSFEARDFEKARLFLDAGFAVLTPTLRGENGNPGRFELLRGEVDDAIAAVRWVAQRPQVDPNRVYAIGHSVGGAVAALVSLFPQAPVRHTGSVGGIYVPQTFVRWTRIPGNRKLVRFDPNDRHELELRTLGPNVRDMVHPHVAYIGKDDEWFIPNAAAVDAQARRWNKPFSWAKVPGDHGSSLRPGLEAFLAIIVADAEDPGPEAGP